MPPRTRFCDLVGIRLPLQLASLGGPVGTPETGGCGGHQPLDQVLAETLSAVDLPVVASGSIDSAARVIHTEVVATVAERSLPPFAPVPPTGAAHGEISAMPTYAGTSVGDVDVTMPAATIVPELTAGLEVPNAR
jgi:hypothetical protein